MYPCDETFPIFTFKYDIFNLKNELRHLDELDDPQSKVKQFRLLE